MKHVIDFINGRDRIVVEELQKKMERFSQNHQFEKAAAVRDQIKSIKDFLYRQKVVTPELIDRDLFVAFAEDDDACAVIFKIREGRIIGRQHYFLTGVEGESLDRIINHLLIRYYQQADFIPKEIYIPIELEETENLEKWLFERINFRVKLIFPQRGEKAKLMRMAFHNANYCFRN